MGKNSKNRKKLLRAFLEKKAEQNQNVSTRAKQYAEAQNRILQGKMKLAKKRAITLQMKQEEQSAFQMKQEEKLNGQIDTTTPAPYK